MGVFPQFKKNKYRLKALLFCILMAMLGLLIKCCKPLQYYLNPNLLNTKTAKTVKAKKRELFNKVENNVSVEKRNFFQGIGFGKSPKESFLMEEIEIKKTN